MRRNFPRPSLSAGSRDALSGEEGLQGVESPESRPESHEGHQSRCELGCWGNDGARSSGIVGHGGTQLLDLFEGVAKVANSNSLLRISAFSLLLESFIHTIDTRW